MGTVPFVSVKLRQIVTLISVIPGAGPTGEQGMSEFPIVCVRAPLPSWIDTSTFPAIDAAGCCPTSSIKDEFRSTYSWIRFPTDVVVAPTLAASLEPSIAAAVIDCCSRAKNPNSMMASETIRIRGNARMNSRRTEPVRRLCWGVCCRKLL